MRRSLYTMMMIMILMIDRYGRAGLYIYMCPPAAGPALTVALALAVPHPLVRKRRPSGGFGLGVGVGEPTPTTAWPSPDATALGCSSSSGHRTFCMQEPKASTAPDYISMHGPRARPITPSGG